MEGHQFYLDVDRQTANWTYSLRLRRYEGEQVGVQVATFNPYYTLQQPDLMEAIVDVLNKALREGAA